MKSLIRTDEDAWTDFEAIRDAKQAEFREILVGVSPTVRRRYDEYARYQRNLEHVFEAAPPFAAQQEKALRHCYDVSTAPLKLLKQRIRTRQSRNAQSKCQCCGIDRPGTFDHYLPYSSFPEFSVHPDDLLPCCSTCNRTRGTNWRENGERRHINLYFDEVEEGERFLVAIIVFHAGKPAGVRFHVDTARATNHAFALRYERHCQAMHLLERFEERAPAELDLIGAEIRAAATSLAADADAIARYLLEVVTERQQVPGANNWEVALRMAAAESRAFIDHCLRHVGHTTGKAST
jgi:hypothetical protein